MIKLSSLIKLYKSTQSRPFKFGVLYSALCLAFIFSQLIYLNIRYNFLVEKVPLLYTKNWGEAQLVSKNSLFLIPAISIVISLVGLFFVYYLGTKFYKYGPQIIIAVVLFFHSFVTYSLLRIMGKSLLVQNPMLSLQTIQLIVPFFLALLLSFVLSPLYVQLMEKWKIVTDPSRHVHPGMILKQPSARGGGLFFSILFVLFSLALVPMTLEVMGILILALSLSIVGIFDDIQNTRSNSNLKVLENPLIRLAILFLFVGALYFFGVKIDFLSNPLDGFFYLTDFTFNFGGISIQPISWIFTTVWIVWTLNLLSWSNGIDGQYGGIVGIAFIIVALLCLRFGEVTSAYFGYARLAFVAAGISLGLTRVTWHPSKIMWGFGAMSAGLVLSSISILIQAKVITSILILLIPFLDATVTFFRRIFAGKSPWKGDREHLHHLLMDRGFSEQKTAMFYWFVTVLFGGLSLFSVNRPLVQGILMLLGVFFFTFIIVSLRLSARKKALPLVEK